MGMLDELLGAGRREDYRDFVDRYDRGAPYEGIDDDEADRRYREVAPRLSREDYEESAREAFSRMRPEERREFGRHLREEGRRRDAGFVDLDGDGIDDRMAEDPGVLAQVTARIHERRPDLLGQILGGGRGDQGGQGGGQGALSNPLAKAALAGIAAMAAKRFMR
jgi:hypothetical protein